MSENKFLTQREIQIEETKVLGKVINFLEKNDIPYYIWFGTLLGTVRHKGFIPWDDDIDIVIPRPDYDKLISILKSHNYIDENIEGICWELGNSDWPFLKIINKGIAVDEADQCDLNLWIDIFPLDGVPSDIKTQKRYFKKILSSRRWFLFKRMDVRNLKTNNPNIIKKFLKFILLKIIDYDKIIDKHIKLCKKYNYESSEFFCNTTWQVALTGEMPKSLLKDIDIYDFENLKVKSVKNSDILLKMWYGENYMELPPEEKRVSHEFKAWRIDDEEN